MGIAVSGDLCAMLGGLIADLRAMELSCAFAEDVDVY